MNKEKEKLSKAEKIMYGTDSFIQRNAKKIVIIFVVILVLLIGLGAFVLVSNNNTEKTYAALYALEQDYNTLISTEEADYADFYAKADEFNSSNKVSTYEGAKARLMIANLKFDEGVYEEAYELYMDVAEAHSKDYLAPVALMSAAAAKENMGNADEALTLYTRVWDTYGKDAPEAPKALFSQARLIEASGDIELASSIYNQLADEFPSSYYSALAQAKLLTL